MGDAFRRNAPGASPTSRLLHGFASRVESTGSLGDIPVTASYLIRPIRPDDNTAMAAIIRTVMPEFGADGPGFAIHDPEVDHMAQAYARPGRAFFVVEREGVIVGGAGVAPLDGGEPDVCELRKMYFLPHARGIGAGTAMMQRCLDAAQALYRRSGFAPICHAMGGTGHHGCDRYYLRDL